MHEAAVVGRPDERWGEVPVAYIASRGEEAPSEVEVIAFCSERLARYKVPRNVRLVAALPRNPSGKVLKRELRDREAQAAKGVTTLSSGRSSALEPTSRRRRLAHARSRTDAQRAGLADARVPARDSRRGRGARRHAHRAGALGARARVCRRRRHRCDARPTSSRDGSRFVYAGQHLLRRLEESPLIFIAVVGGFALGGGLELALACDLIVASEHGAVRLSRDAAGSASRVGWHAADRPRSQPAARARAGVHRTADQR